MGRNTVGLALLGLILISLALSACGSYQFKGAAYPEPRMAPDFELTTGDGGRFRLSDRRGDVVLLFFGYTSCPDVCPTTLAEARRILQGLEDDVERVTFLFITVDPERDTPEVLATYTGAFHPAIIGLTGTPAELEAVRQAYGVFAEKEVLEGAAAGYIVNHTARVFLVDAEGRLRLSYSFGTSPEDILADIRHLTG
ncbi:MAG: SCO family protein [Anaerolineae bacterium]